MLNLDTLALVGDWSGKYVIASFNSATNSTRIRIGPISAGLPSFVIEVKDSGRVQRIIFDQYPLEIDLEWDPAFIIQEGNNLIFQNKVVQIQFERSGKVTFFAPRNE